VLNNISFNTYLAVAEKSKDPVQSHIYLLHLSKFQNDSNTIVGTNTIQQDVTFLKTINYLVPIAIFAKQGIQPILLRK